MRIGIGTAAVALCLGLFNPGAAQAQASSEALARLQAGEFTTSFAQARGYYYREGPYDRRYYSDRRYHRRDNDAAAAGVAGLALGAILGGVIAQQQAQQAPRYVVPDQSAVAYCAQRFRSYDPAIGTYLGYDGDRHACP